MIRRLIKRNYWVPTEKLFENNLEKVKEKIQLPIELIDILKNYNEKIEKQNKLLEEILKSLNSKFIK
jgi:hypothetical protein